MFWCTLIIVVLTYVIIKNYNSINFWKNKNIKYVKPWPLLGNFGNIFLKRSTFIEEFEKIYYAYPDKKFIGFHQLNKPILLIRDPEIIKLVTIKDFNYFMNHMVLVTEEIDPLFGKNLFSLHDNRWRHMRAILSPAFTGSKMRTMYVLIKDCAEQFAQHFMDIEKQNGIISVDMKDIFTRYTNDVVATTAFGIKCDSLKDKNNEFYLMGKEISDFGFKTNMKFLGYMLAPFIMKYFNIRLFGDNIKNFFKNIVENSIETREKEGIIRPDMIHLLMEARKGNLRHETKTEDAGFATVDESEIGKLELTEKPQLTIEDITAQAAGFFLAGYDTSSTLLSFLAYELAVNREIQQKLHQEIDDLFNKCGENIDYESLLKMKYLDMVVSETFRFWPPAMFTERQCNNTYTLTDGQESVTLERDQSVWIPV